MNASVYLRYELLRTIRNKRVLILSLSFPVVLYLALAVPNRHLADFSNSGISAPLYFMVGLAAFGTMNAMLAGGARIAADRAVGWNRQLRVTPLTPRGYVGAKVLTGYGLALVSIVSLYICGAALGVRLSADRWLEMTGLILVGLVPFAALGVALGHLLTADSIGPAVGGSVALLALLGGTWFPITGNGVFPDIAHALPSYWLVQAAHEGLGDGGWGAQGWLTVLAWTVALTALAVHAYRRDTAKGR